MSRAQSNQVFNTATGNSATDQGNAVGSFGTASNANNARLANPGFDPATKTAITSSGQDANNAAFDSLAQTAQAREARTRNDAGSNELADSLAMQKGQGSADAAMAAQKTIGNAALQDRSAGIAEAGNLYGTSLSGANNTLGIANSSANANPSFGDQFGSALGGGLGKSIAAWVAPARS
jgi:hypothetical protein